MSREGAELIAKADKHAIAAQILDRVETLLS